MQFTAVGTMRRKQDGCDAQIGGLGKAAGGGHLPPAFPEVPFHLDETRRFAFSRRTATCPWLIECATCGVWRGDVWSKVKELPGKSPTARVSYLGFGTGTESHPAASSRRPKERHRSLSRDFHDFHDSFDAPMRSEATHHGS